MWSEHRPVQTMVYRLLSSLKKEAWAQELIEQLYFEQDIVDWANEGLIKLQDESGESQGHKTVDSNGNVLQEDDSVTLIKDLEVKGAGFTAKRGTLVKGIRLTNNPEHIEGKVNGVQIVLVAKFLKKV